MIQAPSWNLVTRKTRATTAVRAAPTALTTIFTAQPQRAQQRPRRAPRLAPPRARPIFHQRRVMPAWESVKDRNTPIA